MWGANSMIHQGLGDVLGVSKIKETHTQERGGLACLVEKYWTDFYNG